MSGPGHPKTWRDYRADVIVGVVVAVLTGSSAPWWAPPVYHWIKGTKAEQSTVVGFVGSCATFRVVAQNRWAPVGAAKRAAPDVMSAKVGGYAPNEVIPVDGWVHSSIAYPTNRPPWNSDVWFHVADGSGWVSFAGVRELPTTTDPTGLSKDGGSPAATPEQCHGSVQ